MEITDQAEADNYFEKCVRHTMKVRPCSRGWAESIEKQNLGYWAGYHDHETRLRVEKLFRCSHPVLGVATQGPPTSEEAFEKGRLLGCKL